MMDLKYKSESLSLNVAVQLYTFELDYLNPLKVWWGLNIYRKPRQNFTVFFCCTYSEKEYKYNKICRFLLDLRTLSGSLYGENSK